MKLNNKLVLAGILPLLLSGCSLDHFSPKPDDPEFAPALPEESFTDLEPTGSLYSPYSTNNGLYTDTRAHRVGDLISVTLDESTRATKKADTELERKSSNTIGDTVIGGHKVSAHGYTPTFSNSNSSNYEGTSDASQSNSLRGQISVSVVRVLGNGNLMVRGEKWLMLNNGNEYVRLTGIIRSEDISSDNTVSSQRVANARIQYGGTGDFASTQERGWLSKFFNSVFNIFF
ncbi:MAG: flagellar basal body L-ring protein FlgH [Succinivibrionaceae bacterium]|nr:flagellar basal body L-ring protein FlgH [Succinivibrionaceae bacterium]